MIKSSGKLDLLSIWFIVYMFWAVFQPPILPISFIYVFGVITAVLLFINYHGVLKLHTIYSCGLNKLIKLYFIMLVYLVFVGGINILVSSNELMNNRIRCINQLIVLSLIQFMGVWYIIDKAEKKGYGFETVIEKLMLVGGIQGICSIAAYLSPSIRSAFTVFADQTLFTNAFFVERRGYGFSETLIDTFGYGMGLIGGYLILSNLSKDKIKKIILLFLIFFSIFTNARTGLVILAIAFILKLLQAEKPIVQLGKLIIAIPILYIIIFIAFPRLFDMTVHSNNITISWVMRDVQELYNILLFGRQTGVSITGASFLSNFGNIPNDILIFLFGSGHSIYDTGSILGFRTDVGYVNSLWEFGLIGTIAIMVGILSWMIKPFFQTKNSFVKSLIILNVASYVIVLLKAILIGYNPGVFVNYLSTALVYYFSNKDSSLEWENHIFEIER